jgi:small GTP-binding protein
MDSETEYFRFKMVLFGTEAVGKTSLVDRFVNNKFEENYISTLGYNVFEKIIICDNISISLMIYDIGGQEKFRDLRKKYAENADLAFLVYDITNQVSFDALQEWKQDLAEFAPNATFIIIGNKRDLQLKRKVPTDKAAKLALELGALEFFETSARTGAGVQQAFNQLAIKTYETRFK